MDKYEYKLKTEQMLELMEDGAYRKAAEIADTIDWRRVRNASMLTQVSDIYEKNKEYQKSYEVLNAAYHRAEGSRKIISRLCTLALKTGNVDEAIDYYDDFVQIAPKDPNQYILRYQILREQRAPIEQQIEALEEFKKSEYIEEWAYELAKLYQEAGMTAECLEECDDLILWFSEGQYVYKAMELKMQYKPLTPSQQQKYDHRYEKPSSETEEMPDLLTYAEEKSGELAEPEPEEENVPEDELARDVVSEDDKPADAELGLQEPEAAPKKKKLGDTMPLNEALKKLLHPEKEDFATPEIPEEEPDVSDLESAIEEIESVADLGMADEAVKKRSNRRKAAVVSGEMTEIVPEPDQEETEAEESPAAAEMQKIEEDVQSETAESEAERQIEADDQIEGQMSLEDILAGWEQQAEEPDVEEESAYGEPVEPELDEIFDEAEEFAFTADEAEELLEEDGGELPDEAEELFEEESEELPDEAEELLEEDGEELPDEAEELPEEGSEAGSDESVKINNKEEKKNEPILPPDIQRLIDEIEGVIPPQEPEPVKPAKKPEEPHENMGRVADELRIDDLDDFLEDEEDYFETEEYFGEDTVLDGADEEEYFDEGDDLEDTDEEEYFDEDDDLEDTDEEEYFDEDDDLEDTDEEEYFDEDDDLEDIDEEEYFDEDDDLEDVDEEEYFGEDDDLEDVDEEEYFEEEENGVPDIAEEFRVNPEHNEEPDDREIPDDDDDMDILSATTPLSRKETAKMIATGKTAPLPLGEISDALSMSDTGFIVHGRYDLETQSGIGTRAGLTEEQKKLFSYFVPVRGMSEQLVDVLEQDKNCTNRGGTSKTGNLLIIGNKGNGKTVLAVDVVKAIQKQRNIRQGKVAIVTGDSLNKKKIGDIFSKLYGGALIIEKAGRMNEKTVARLNKAMEKDTGELLIVLEEQRKPLDRLLSSNREFRRKFTSRLEVPIFINDELVTFGQTYAQENGYRIDEMGILALYSKIDSLQREDHAVTVAEVKEVMDNAIAHSQKASAKKLVKRVFGRNTDDADRILLSEKDFNV